MTRAQPGDQGAGQLESTAQLVARARAGDLRARETLFERLLPLVRRFAHRRIPAAIRDVNDTDDLVQEALLRAFKQMESIELRGEGALFAYVRRILLNRIADELRRVRRRPQGPLPADDLPDGNRTPLEVTVGHELVEAYEAALETLPEDQRQAVILRVDFGLSHQEVADILGRPSWNAARMLVVRGLLKVAERMGEVR